jgi:hypothetical protein
LKIEANHNSRFNLSLNVAFLAPTSLVQRMGGKRNQILNLALSWQFGYENMKNGTGENLDKFF